MSLHQQDIEKIEALGQLCKHLKILLLQNNLISRIGALLVSADRRPPRPRPPAAPPPHDLKRARPARGFAGAPAQRTCTS